MVCRILNFDADYWKPGLLSFVPRGAQLSAFSLVPPHLAKGFTEFFWNHFEPLSELLKKWKRKEKLLLWKTSFFHVKKQDVKVIQDTSCSTVGSHIFGDERFNHESLGNIKGGVLSAQVSAVGAKLWLGAVSCVAIPRLGKFWRSSQWLLPLAVTRANVWLCWSPQVPPGKSLHLAKCFSALGLSCQAPPGWSAGLEVGL